MTTTIYMETVKEFIGGFKAAHVAYVAQALDVVKSAGNHSIKFLFFKRFV